MSEPSVATFESVTKLLKEEGLTFETDVTSRLWFVTFDLDPPRIGRRPLTVAMPALEIISASSYLLIFSYLSNPKLTVGLDNIEADVLRRLMRLAAGDFLARIDVLEFEQSSTKRALFIARSECSVVGIDGGRLRRRMEAVAELAAKIDSEL